MSRRCGAEIVLTLVALLVWWGTYRDFGVTWDETPHVLMGEAARKYLFAGAAMPELQEDTIPKSEFYSPALDVACAVLINRTGLAPFTVRHLVQGLLWVAMFWPVGRLGRRVAGPPGAWAAGLALLGLPVLLGHACNNPKDIPLASAAVWLLLASTWAAAARRLTWRHALALGAAFGCVLAARPGAWFLAVVPGMVPGARLWWVGRLERRPVRAILLNSVWVLVVTLFLAWGMMIALWPQAHASPFLHPIRSALLARNYVETYSVLFAGELFQSNALPRSYLNLYLLLTTPIPMLLLAAWGQVVLARRAGRRARVRPAALMLAFVLWFPLGYFVVARPNVYDGMRHFLFVLPPLAVLAGVGAVSVGGWLARRLGRWAALAPGLLLLEGVPAMVALHPYEASYFNVLGGDHATLHERFELDFWISSYREAAAWINQEQKQSPRVLTVAVAGNDFSLPAFVEFVDPEIRIVPEGIGRMPAAGLPGEIDYYVGTVRYDNWRKFPERPIVHRVARDGMLFTVIRGRPGQAEH